MALLLLALVPLLLVLIACGKGGVAQPGTGIRGSVSIGPQCPVEQANSPCPDRPFQGQVQATAADGATTTTTTDADGRFTVDVSPGTYDVVALTTNGGGPPTAIPQTVVVREGAYTSVALELDSGIR
jgi:hypothetical protein